MRKISEARLNTADTKEIFKAAVNYRNTPTGLGKIFKGLRKDKIELTDLQQAWKDHSPNPFPDDTRDITAILLDHGFSEKEIKKVYNQVFGQDDSGETMEPEYSPAMQKLADYIVKNNMKDEMISFLEKNYQFKESVLYDGKLVVEDIRQIFTEIVHEERSGRSDRLRKLDKQLLGRTRK